MFLIAFDLSGIAGDGLKRSIESKLEPILSDYMMADKIAPRTYMTRSDDDFNTPTSIASMILWEFGSHFDQDGVNIVNVLKSIKLTVCRIQLDSKGKPIILTDDDRKNVYAELQEEFI